MSGFSFCFLGLCGCVHSPPPVMKGQHPAVLEREARVTLRLDYLVYVPEGYADSREEWPLLLFLHGAGERGDDVNLVAKHGPPKRVRNGDEFPFLIVSPQCPEDAWWGNELQVMALEALLDEVESRYRVDRSRIYLTGLSMGGYGTWRLAHENPHRFAAIAPVCGGGDPEWAAGLAELPVWVFHGAKDTVVEPEKSREMVEALKTAGGEVRYTEYPEAGHDSWTETYANPELYEWLLSHSRAD